MWFPYSLSIVLTVSLLVALFIVPIMEHHFIRRGLGGQTGHVLSLMQRGYDRLIAVCFAHRRLTIATGLCAVLAGAWLFLLVPQKLMPRASRSLFNVEVYLPSGTDIRHTTEIADSVAAILARDHRVTNLTTFYGSGSPRYHAAFVPQFGGTNFAQLIVNTHSDSETQAVLDDYTDRMANYFPDAQVLFKQIEYTDAPYPVIVRLVGDNLDSLHVATDSIVNRFNQNPALATVSTKWGSTQSRFDIMLHPEEANRIGMSKSLLSLNLAMRYADGIPAASIWEGTTELPIVLKDAQNGGQTVESFKDIRVSGLLPTLTTVPLSQVANVKPAWGDGAITRTNGLRTAEVFATISRDAKIGQVTKQIYKDLETLRLPEGISIERGGQAKTESTYRPQIYLGAAIAVVIIAFILLFHLKSIPLMLLMMGSLLFAVPGAALGLYLSGFEFGATAVLGIISLMGIIVRCGIIVVDYAEDLRRQADSVIDAARLSTERRFRPIFLTSAAASMGVIPMVIKGTPLWGPMGIVICVGAMVSMVFIVTMIPVGYSIIMDRLVR